jgi:DNA-binding FadR family transcriptional regulator
MASAGEGVFTPIKNRRTFEQVSNKIKKLIFDGVFQPGDKLPSEIELAHQFQVGRQSVREALRILELSGFIAIQKGGGGGAVIKDTIANTISGLFLDAFQLEKISLEELTINRIEFEKIVLKYAIQNAEPADIERLQRNIDQSQTKLKANAVIIDENIQFHRLLARASKNYLLIIVVEAITAAVRRSLEQLNLKSGLPSDESVIQSKNTVNYHQNILDAILAKDLELAAEWLENHLNEVKNRLQLLDGENIKQSFVNGAQTSVEPPAGPATPAGGRNLAT